MKSILLVMVFLAVRLPLFSQLPVIVDHQNTHLYQISAYWIDKARSDLHIAYGHTSHGSQLISGMNGLYDRYGTAFAFNDGGTDGALDIHDRFMAGDLGNPDFETWASRTRTYLDDENNSDVNVIIWSWCGELSSAASEDVQTYLALMNQLEMDYPGVKFVYMTGHLNGTGENGNLHLRNEQIRSFCENNNKILYDFADIESFDPSGNVNFMKLFADDNCEYDSDNNGSLDENWAIEYSEAFPDSCYYFGDCAHSQALNCQQKGIAAWYLWARLAGWDGYTEKIQVTGLTVSGENDQTTIDTDGGTLQLFISVEPEDATDQSVTWSIQNGTGEASISNSGLVKAVANGTVDVTALANDGSGISANLTITISGQTIPVTDITVSAEGGENIIADPGGTLQLIAIVEPEDATDKTITWSLQNTTGQASIDETGLVTAIADGTVTVMANSTDGSEVEGSLVITVTNQDLQTQMRYVESGLMRFTYHSGVIGVEINEDVASVQLHVYTLAGVSVYKRLITEDENINISHLAHGIYIILLDDLKGNPDSFKVVVP